MDRSVYQAKPRQCFPMTIAQQIISGLQEMLDGKPVKQVMVRRMIVKGKTVYTRESFTAPIRRPR